MKGGMYRIRGKHFSYSLIALVIGTVFLWCLEKKPLVTVLSNLDQLDSPDSDVLLVVPHDSKDIVNSDLSVQEHQHSHEVPRGELITNGSVASDIDSTSRINSITKSNVPELTRSLDDSDEKDAQQNTNEPELTPVLDSNGEKDAQQNTNEPELTPVFDSNGEKDANKKSNEPKLTPSLDSDDSKGARQRSNDQQLTFAAHNNGDKDAHESSKQPELNPSLESNDGKGAHRRSIDQKLTPTIENKGEKDARQGSLEPELIRPLNSSSDEVAHQKSNEQELIRPLDSKNDTVIHQKSHERDLTPLLGSNGGKEAHQRDDRKSEFFPENKECNYGKGRWIMGNKTHPLYSGLKCKQWLSDMWACRLTKRPDFSYEAFRWQPEDCKMPDFNGPTFLKKMQDKTIAFVGDSLGRQQFQSLMCMVTGGEHHPEVQDVGKKYGFFLNSGAARPNGWAFRFPATNTTILYHWSASLCELQPLNSSDPHTPVAMHLDRPSSFLQQFLPALDVIILNTGHHWNRGKLNANRWVMYVGGKPNTDKIRARMGNAKDFTIHSVARWVDEQIGTHHPHVKAFFRTISPRHFANGDWNTGGSCDNTIPLANGNMVIQDESRDQAVAGAVRGTRVKLLDVTALSQLRDEGHISRYRGNAGFQDCLHWCLPGVPDTWNEILAAQI